MKTANDIARRAGFFFVLDPSVSALTTSGSKVFAAADAIGGPYVLAGAGLSLDTDHALAGTPAIVSSASGTGADGLWSAQSPLYASSGPTRNAPWGSHPWTIAALVDVLAPSPTLGGGLLIGTPDTRNMVLGFGAALVNPLLESSLWTGGAVNTALFMSPITMPSGPIFVALSYDGARLRLLVNGIDKSPTGFDGVLAGPLSVAVASPGFGLRSWSSAHAPASARYYWAGFCDAGLPREAMRDIGVALATDAGLRTSTHITVIGDSIPAGVGTTYPTTQSWPAIAAAKIRATRPCTIDNRSLTGSRADQWITESFFFPNVVQPLSVLPDDPVLIVQAGTNDLKRPDSGSTSTSSIVKNLLSIVDQAERIGYRAFVATILYNADPLALPREQDRIAINVALNASGRRVIDLAALPGLTTVDDTHPDAQFDTTMGAHAASIILVP